MGWRTRARLAAQGAEAEAIFLRHILTSQERGEEMDFSELVRRARVLRDEAASLLQELEESCGPLPPEE